MKVFLIFILLCFLFGIYFFLYNVTSIGYEQSSQESIKQYEEAILLARSIECPQDGVSDIFVNQLQDYYPDKVFAKKGNDLIIDGFLFKCIENENGIFQFELVKNE